MDLIYRSLFCPTTHSGEHLLRCVWNKLNANSTTKKQQECIPVGCIPSAAVAVSRGVYLVLGGVTGPGVYLVRGVHLVRGVPGPGGWVYLVPGGCTWSGGVPGQVLPHCGQTHACKNITFATSLRTVIIQIVKLTYGKSYFRHDDILLV